MKKKKSLFFSVHYFFSLAVRAAETRYKKVSCDKGRDLCEKGTPSDYHSLWTESYETPSDENTSISEQYVLWKIEKGRQEITGAGK
ncbi:hypothetical protein CEXT_342281 [Caerostris extrusa]|uniref:Uncharacterized protein n=1 Tax=Caerostris extrusa TaxID=172846 RepID=A0AAV4VD16_CAEEX|nr:hypothetical protein CEXT_342281 [Caerostris extrusa]